MQESEQDPILMIDATYAKLACEETSGNWKDKLFAAWERVDRDSMQSNRYGTYWWDYRLRAGIGGLLLFLNAKGDQEGVAHVKFEVEQITNLNTMFTALKSGIPMSLEDALSGLDKEKAAKYPPLGILHWYKEWMEHNKKMQQPEYRRVDFMCKDLIEYARKCGVSGVFHGIQIGPAKPVEDKTGIETYNAEQLREIAMSIADLSIAMHSPAVGGHYPHTVESMTVRFATDKIKKYVAAEESKTQPNCDDWL